MNYALQPTALIAEDEPVLARTLSRLLAQVWPELRIVGVAEDGLKAIELALDHTPDVMFLDIKMPGRTGLEVAETVADEWPQEKAAPLFVFITAYDEFAIPAFEQAAVDYILKPSTIERLDLSAQRLKQRLSERAQVPGSGAAEIRSETPPKLSPMLTKIELARAPPEKPVQTLRPGPMRKRLVLAHGSSWARGSEEKVRMEGECACASGAGASRTHPRLPCPPARAYL